MSVIEQVAAHYNANKQQHIDVPEWGVDVEQAGPDGTPRTVRQPLRIYWQLLTVDRRQQVFSQSEHHDVDILVAMAEDQNGKKLFGIGDKPQLKLAADAVVITRVVMKMIGSARLTDAMVDAAEKN